MNMRQIELGELIKPAQVRRAEKKIFPVLSMTMHGGLVDQSVKFKKRVASSDTSQYKIVTKNQLVVGFPIDEGVISFQNLYCEAIVSPAYDIWELTAKDVVESQYLERYLRSPRALGFYSSKLRGTTARRRTLPDDIFLSIPIPVPSLGEQRRIATILNQAEQVRANRRASLVQIEILTQSIFNRLFGQPTRNSQWPKVKLQSAAEIITGYPFRSEEYVKLGGAVKLCRGANVLPGRLDWSDLESWPKSRAEDLSQFGIATGDIVIAMDRPWILEGFKIAQVSEQDCPALLVQRVARIRGRNGASNEFLFNLLRQPAFARHCKPTETTVPHISPTEIRSFEFHLPPAEIQRNFARHVCAVEDLKGVYSASLAELDALFASLQYRAFRGEL